MMSPIVKIAVVLVSLFGFMLSVLMFVYAAFSWLGGVSHRTASAGLSFVGLLCLLTTIQLIRGKTWAWWGALGFAVLVFGLGMFCVWEAFYSTDAYMRSEAGFAFLLGLVLIAGAGITGALLNLPKVRRTFLVYASPPQ